VRDRFAKRCAILRQACSCGFAGCLLLRWFIARAGSPLSREHARMSLTHTTRLDDPQNAFFLATVGKYIFIWV
jgi:hypothetical protein